MANEWILFVGLIVIGTVLIVLGILIYFWFKTRSIVRSAPMFTNKQDLDNINKDITVIERRNIQNDGYQSTRIREPEEKVAGASEREGEGQDTEEAEIRRLREEISRTERELGGN